MHKIKTLQKNRKFKYKKTSGGMYLRSLYTPSFNVIGRIGKKLWAGTTPTLNEKNISTNTI